MTLNLKQKILIANASIGLVLIVIIIFIVYPSIKDILKLKNEINTIQGQLEERYQKTQKLKKSLKELNQIKQVTTQMEQVFVKPGEEIDLITTLEKIANSHNINQTMNLNLVDETKINTESKNKDARIFPVYYRLSFLNEGTFLDHLAYLKDLEELPYYVIIENINFEKRKNQIENEVNPINLRFDAIIYVATK
ncbi:MAG: hypothetical protein US42_C0005G0044 [Candidatus Magasanikbacteria bacterium GW2011_GWC2_37_14]|uniref:Type IV pilus assembly protein PilO n=1 Tax=Candidatus Magasanikbacteria bacterium GW2011_GWC2_37_14 TaxID=1619046 RepID=A0A0G0IUI0_9BACT|nr:MAG: hypothetical protein US42_C0005G0044 [Candidatus Magasanikbacteria bacterium GW2011_GWC2_37_14]